MDDEEEQEDLDENKNDPEWDEMVNQAAQRGSRVNICKYFILYYIICKYFCLIVETFK